jgi:hypothetical protein
MSRVRLTTVALLVVFVAGGVVSASASAGIPVWVVKGSVLEAAKTSKATAKFGKLTIKWEDKTSKAKFEGECKKASGEVKLFGGEPGTDEHRALAFEECALVEGASECKMRIGGVAAEELPGWQTELEAAGGKTYDKTIELAFSLALEGCEKPRLSKTWLFRGALKAEVKNESGKIKVVYPVTKVEGDTLKSEGAEASLSGEGELTEKEGGSLEFKEETALPRAWYVCLEAEGGGQKYTENQCKTTGGEGKFALQLLPLGVQLKITSKGGTQSLKVSGLGGLELLCKTVKDKGWIENNVAASNGIDDIEELDFLECTVVTPAQTPKCEFKKPGAAAGSILINDLETKLVTFAGGGIGDLIKKAGSTTFVELEIGKEENSSTKKFKKACGVIPTAAQKIEGQIVAKIEASGKLHFTDPAQEGTNLELGGFAATYAGEVENEMEGGGLIEAREEL